MQFVVLWSQKEKPLILKGAEMPRELECWLKIQRGEEDGDAQNIPIRLQRVLLLAVCTAEGLIYCWFIPLWVAFALTGSQLPNRRLLLLGKVHGAVGGKGGAHLSSNKGWSRNVQRLSLLLVFSRGSEAAVWSVPCHTESHGQQLQSVLPSPLFLLLALDIKTNQHWSLGRKKKRNSGGEKKALQYTLNMQAEAAQSPVAQVLLLMFHSLLLAVPAVQCQHLWMCLLPVALPCVWRSLHQHLPCRNAAATTCPVVPVYL